ncbi:TPA: Dam family site-specific DNA-(adenine-N6)-methyltransferase [Escherichia coli]|nr:Dam family site-specific DNA-(adenine-N6)-methyltransferase [Escherichia coli]
MKQNVNLRYGSVCSGIEAASIAWEPLGMRPAWFAEIEPFPSAVLAHRWPHVANLGDMTKLAKKVLAGEIESPDVLVGGTPCQAFSIAGLRGGLDDERGALTLKYVELANAIDDKRSESFLKPTVIVWENVPGVLSSADNAFGCFLAGLAGEDAPFEPGDRPESGKSNAFWRWDGKTGCHVPKWPQCGCIYGPQRKVAWRILDAQYFGVAQRRRRVFVVASARTDLDPATVLFEFEGVRRNIAPSRGEGKETTRYTSDIAIRSCDDTNIVAMAHGQGGAEIKTDNSAPTLTCNHEAPIVLLGDGRMRRLTPVECERLQGFPDGHTLIPTEKRKKVSSDELAYLRKNSPDLNEEEAAMLAADGPRYKAIGNSMAIPVMRWIGERITKAACRQNEGRETKERKVKPAAEFERSIFKWAGGKFGVLEQIFRYLPEGKRLIEPFVGGGSVFTNAGFRHNLLNDINGDLINFYQTLQREGHSLVTLSYSFFQNYNNADAYLEVREAFNRGKYDQLHHAAAFLYLNRHCFNGVTRYNQNGEFNVGYGKYKAPYFPHAEMEAFLADDVLKNTSFVSGDFAGVIEAAGEGDVIFCDPPYEPLPDTEGFTSYSGNSFRFDEQKRLVSLLVEAHQRGAKVVITNSGAPNIRELYEGNGFKVHHMAARRSVSCKASTRVVANDIIAIMK